MCIELHRRLQLQKRQIVCKGGGVVLPMDDDPFHVPADVPLRLQVAGDVELAEDGDQGGEEAGLTMGCRHHVLIAN